MLWPNGDKGLAFLKRLKSYVFALSFSPSNLVLYMVKERHDVAKAVLDIDVAVCYRDEEDFQLLGKC